MLSVIRFSGKENSKRNFGKKNLLKALKNLATVMLNETTPEAHQPSAIG